MKMTSNFCKPKVTSTGLCFCLIAGAMFKGMILNVFAQGTPGFVSVKSGPLEAKLIVEQKLGRNLVHINLVNSSSEFQCIANAMLDTATQHIALEDKMGHDVPLNSYAEWRPTLTLGFGYDDAYIFIRPNETKRVVINAENFRTEQGQYNYKVTILYYRCRDIIDSRRIAAKRPIDTYVLLASGTIELPPEN